MLDFRRMSDDELYFPELFTDSPASDGDTQPLNLPDAPLLLPEYDLTSADWPEVEPLDSADADAADGYTDSYDDGEGLP